MVFQLIKKIFFAGLVIGLSVFSVGCSEDGSYKDPDDNNRDGGTDIPPGSWTIQTVEDEEVGLQVKIDVGPDGAPGVAYWDGERYQDGVCLGTGLTVDPPRYRWELRYATRSPGGDTWSAEIVDTPSFQFGPTGLDFALSPSGAPTMAYQGGEPEISLLTPLCISSDAVVTSRTGADWTTDAVGTGSGDATVTLEPPGCGGDTKPCCQGCAAGYVVGVESALAFDSDGNPAVLHRDSHFLQGRDTAARADAEFAWRNGGGTWSLETVDPSSGAGFSNALVFDAQGRPVLFYRINKEDNEYNRNGFWAARRETDGIWSWAYLHVGAIDGSVSAAVDPVTGEVAIAFYSVLKQGVYVMRLTDPENFDDVTGGWDKELVSSSIYDEGLSVSLAFTPGGRAALAYHRCKRFGTEGGSCNINDEAVVFAMEGPAGWSTEPVKRGTDGSCGDFVSLAIADDGTAYVAFRCTELIDGEYLFRLYVAEKAIGGAS